MKTIKTKPSFLLSIFFTILCISSCKSNAANQHHEQISQYCFYKITKGRQMLFNMLMQSNGFSINAQKINDNKQRIQNIINKLDIKKSMQKIQQIVQQCLGKQAYQKINSFMNQQCTQNIQNSVKILKDVIKNKDSLRLYTELYSLLQHYNTKIVDVCPFIKQKVTVMQALSMNQCLPYAEYVMQFWQNTTFNSDSKPTIQSMLDNVQIIIQELPNIFTRCEQKQIAGKINEKFYACVNPIIDLFRIGGQGINEHQYKHKLGQKLKQFKQKCWIFGQTKYQQL